MIESIKVDCVSKYINVTVSILAEKETNPLLHITIWKTKPSRNLDFLLSHSKSVSLLYFRHFELLAIAVNKDSCLSSFSPYWQLSFNLTAGSEVSCALNAR